MCIRTLLHMYHCSRHHVISRMSYVPWIVFEVLFNITRHYLISHERCICSNLIFYILTVRLRSSRPVEVQWGSTPSGDSGSFCCFQSFKMSCTSRCMGFTNRKPVMFAPPYRKSVRSNVWRSWSSNQTFYFNSLLDFFLQTLIELYQILYIDWF